MMVKKEITNQDILSNMRLADCIVTLSWETHVKSASVFPNYT